VLRRDGIEAFRTAARDLIEPTAPLPARPRAEAIGLHRLGGGACAIGVALAFGQADAGDLIALARIANTNGARWAATGPGRALLLGPIDEMTGFVLATAADNLGFVVDPRDPRQRIAACAGAPACASGLIAARAIAARLAESLPPRRDGIALHVSGCAKGCAHPTPAPLTLVGTERGCGIVRNGTARSRPERHIDPRDIHTEAAAFCDAGREMEDA
jgi:precorrin-3B synthase